jgi:proliferating cell nuclear antigen
MRLVLAEPKYLRDSVSIISDLVSDVKLKFDRDKIEIIAMDPANVAMIIFRLLSSAFVEYNVPAEQLIGINLDSFKQVLRRAKPSDTIIIELDEEKNRLKIQLKGESTRNFNLALTEIDEKLQKIPDLKFNAKVEMNTNVFDEAIEDMDIISDAVNLEVKQGKFIIHSAGTTSDGKIEVNKDEETSIVLDKEGSKAKYSVEYLKKIIKGGKLSDKVSLEFGKDYPLKIEYKVLDKLQLATILAPRVATE